MIEIAVPGLEAMGLPMATQLTDDFSVLTYDASGERRKLAEKAGLKVAVDTPEAAEGVGIALVAARNATQLEALLYGLGGIVAASPKDAVVILTSMVGIAAAESVTARLEKDGIGLVDAPVPDRPARTGEGDLLAVCGAPPRNFKKACEVLEAMANKLVLVGDGPSKGQALKTVSQLLCGVHIVTAGEALALTGKLGFDRCTALEVPMSEAAESFILGHHGPHIIKAYEGGDSDITLCLGTFTEDMGIMTPAAKDTGMVVPMAAAVEQLCLMGYVRGQGAMDGSTAIRAFAPDSED